MQSDKLNFDQPGSARYTHVPWDYKPERASGLAAGLQTQQFTETGQEAETVSSVGRTVRPKFDGLDLYINTAITKVFHRTDTTNQSDRTPSSNARYHETSSHHENRSFSTQSYLDDICCVCRQKYSWEDERIFTKCCDMAIGAQCKDQHIAKSGECWNCHEKELQSEAASETEFWVSHDPRYFVKETKNLPLCAVRLSKTDAGRQSETSLPKPFAETSKSANDINASEFNTTQSSQPLFVGRSKEDCEREATNYALKGNGQVTLYNESLNGCFAGTNTTAPTKHVSSYNGSMSAQSESSEDYQQDSEGSIDESRKSKEAMQYLLRATEHLEEVCDEYGDQVSDEDRNQILDGILKVLGGKLLFQ